MLALTRRVAVAVFATAAALATSAQAQKKYDVGATDTEIKMGNIMPYSGPASSYGVIGLTGHDGSVHALTASGSGNNILVGGHGTAGQSSLGYLQKLPASELKIDKSFVQTIVSDNRNAIMVRSTIELAHQLGMKVVAEGIEDEACLQRLAEMGCDTGQGYHIGRPMPAFALSEFLVEEVRAAA